MVVNAVVRLAIVICLIGGVLGCQSHSNASNNLPSSQTAVAKLDWQSSQFKQEKVATIEDIFQLTEQQKLHFLNYYNGENNAHVEGHERLYNYLDMILYGFDYRGDTYTASVALSSQSGNCLSLAILTTALANLVNLEIRYQRVNAAPIYQRFHNVMTLSSHVRTHVFAPEKEVDKDVIVVTRKKMIIDYFPEKGNVTGDFIDKSQFLSMFYQNLAGDSIVAKEHDLAYSLLSQAMEIDSQNPETLNTLAVLYKNLGDVDVAERIYQYAIEHTAGSVNILSNYVMLLERQGRDGELTELKKNLPNIDDDNPYRWFDLANYHLAKNDLFFALRYFKRSVEAAPYLHEGYFGLAKTYYQMGRMELAKESMDKAIALAYVPQEKGLYQAKLKVLAKEEL